MSITVQLQVASEEEELPLQRDFETWVQQALKSRKELVEVTIRIVDIPESQALNKQFRKKDKPTNVLSFNCDLPEGVDLPILGDLVICAPVVKQEAKTQQKLEQAHWAHLTIHGTLHLLGYDHQTDTEADVMESLETQLMTELGYDDPYKTEKVGAYQANE